MRSVLSTGAMATLLSVTQAAPANPSLNPITAIIPDLPSNIPTNPKDLPAWAASHGLGFDPTYKHVPSPSEVHNLPHLLSSPASTLPIPRNLTSFPGTLPSLPHPALSPRINGPDDRYQYTNPNAYPWRAVGRVQWSNGVFCTGQLVGPRVVATARHCVPQSGEQVTLSFSPAYDRAPNPSFGTAQVQNAIFSGYKAPGTTCDVKFDAAVMLIDKRYGDGLGWFGVAMPEAGAFNQKLFTTLGYPGDRDGGQRPYRQDGSMLPNPSRYAQFDCDKKTGPIFSDSDVEPGQSGSALWKDNAVIWGIMSIWAKWSDGYGMGGWASGDDFVAMVNHARSTWA